MGDDKDLPNSVVNYKSRIVAALGSFQPDAVGRLVSALLEAREAGSMVYVAGNGGSASTASHFAVDWMLGAGLQDPSLKVLCLNESLAGVTATGNDWSFDDVFQRPMSHLCQMGDVFVVVSASGNSTNLINAAATAQARGGMVVAITGFDGGKLREMADLSVHVETDVGDYGVAEDLHLMVGHMVKEALMALGASATPMLPPENPAPLLEEKIR